MWNDSSFSAMLERGIKNGDYRVLNDEGEESKTEGRGRKAERRRESREGRGKRETNNGVKKRED